MVESWTPNTFGLFNFPLPSPPQENESYLPLYSKSDETISDETISDVTISDITIPDETITAQQQSHPSFTTSQYTLATAAPTTYAVTVSSPTHPGDLTITTATFMSQSPTHQQPPSSASAPSPHPIRQSAFPWPIPHTTITTPTATNPPMNILSSSSSTPTTQLPSPFGGRSFVDITVREILEEYKNDSELLKSIFMAKIEEDKRRTAEEITKAEQARIQLKQLEYELLKEQSKPGGRYPYPYGSQPVPPNGPGSAYIVMSPHDHNHSATPASPSTGSAPYTYMVPVMSPTVLTPTDYNPSMHAPHPYTGYPGQSYGPSPATLPSPSSSRSFQYSTLTTAPQNLHASSPIPPPASPYGHPAQSPMSPIVPDYHHHHPAHPQISPSSSMSTSANLPSPGVSGPMSAATRKRSRSSTNFGSDGMTSRHTEPASPSSASHRDSSPTDANGKQLSHDQVMEVLKAKVLRKNSSSSANPNASSSSTNATSSKVSRGSSSPHISSRPSHRRSTSSTSNRSLDENTHIKKSSSPSASPSPVPPKRFITPIDLKVVNGRHHDDEMSASSASALSSAYTIPSASTPASSIGGHGSPLHLGATDTKRSASPSPRLTAAIIGSGACE